MDQGFRFFPEAASSFAGDVDALYMFQLGVTFFFTFLICALIIFFSIRYRRGSAAPRGNPPVSMLLELSWSVIPLLIALVMFFWGAKLFFKMKHPPANALDIQVVGKQWMWKLQHPQGNAEINMLHVPVNQPIRLEMISEDVIHSFYIPAFRVKQDVLPGYYTQMWFEPTRVGTYHLFCAEYCGTEHSLMRGSIVVMEQDEYADWLAGASDESPAVSGERLFEQFRCNTCHKDDATGRGPSLVNLLGSEVPLVGGGTVTADAQYVRDSIFRPARQVRAGFQPVMPTFLGQLNESQVLDILAYLKTLERPTEPPPPDSNQP